MKTRTKKTEALYSLSINDPTREMLIDNGSGQMMRITSRLPLEEAMANFFRDLYLSDVNHSTYPHQRQ